MRPASDVLPPHAAGSSDRAFLVRTASRGSAPGGGSMGCAVMAAGETLTLSVLVRIQVPQLVRNLSWRVSYPLCSLAYHPPLFGHDDGRRAQEYQAGQLVSPVLQPQQRGVSCHRDHLLLTPIQEFTDRCGFVNVI